MKSKRTTTKSFDIPGVLLQSIKFMIEQYIFACFYLSFLKNWKALFLLVINIDIIGDFHKKLQETACRSILLYAIEFVCVLLVGFVLLEFGYYPVSDVLKEISL